MRVYPKEVSGYTISIKEECKIKMQILKIIKKKKLPKTLEVSLTNDVLKILQESPEHEYKEKYDVFANQHPLFFRNSSKSISNINKS